MSAIPATMAAKRHVVVIGAGVVGVIAALELLKAGHRVTLVDRAQPGGEQASSYGNAGWLSSHSVLPPAEPGIWKKVPGYLADPLGPLAIRWTHLPVALPWLLRYLHAGWTLERVRAIAHSLRSLLVDATALHQELARQAGVPNLIEQQGVLHPFLTKEHYRRESMAWDIRRDLGIGWTELEYDALHALEPALNPRYQYALRVNEAGTCANPGAYVAALAAHAQKQGVEMVRDTALRFEVRQGRLQGVGLAHAYLPCNAAVIAAGVHSKPLAARAGDRIPLIAERGYHVSVAMPRSRRRQALMVSDCKVVINHMDDTLRAAGQVEIAAIDAPPDWRRAEILRDHLFGLYSDIDKNSPVRYWMGSRPSTPDGLPCIGPSSATPDIVYAFGHGHVGFVGSARTGRLIAQFITGGVCETPLQPFDPRRFRLSNMYSNDGSYS